MPVPFYRSISDYDARAIVAYMRTIKPVKNVVPESEYRMALPPNYGPKVGVVAEVNKDDPVAYGKYVTHTLGHCTGCHTPRNKGKLDFSRTNLGGRVLISRRTLSPELGIGAMRKLSVQSRKASVETGANWPG